MADKKLIIINIIIIIAFVTVLTVGFNHSKYTNDHFTEVTDLNKNLNKGNVNNLKQSIIHTKSHFTFKKDLDKIDQNLTLNENEDLDEVDTKNEPIETIDNQETHPNNHSVGES